MTLTWILLSTDISKIFSDVIIVKRINIPVKMAWNLYAAGPAGRVRILVFTKVLQKNGIQTAENGVYSKDGEYVSLSLRGMFRDGIKKDSND